MVVTGSSGYVGNYLLKKIAEKYKEVECIGLSRLGNDRVDEEEIYKLENVR